MDRKGNVQVQTFEIPNADNKTACNEFLMTKDGTKIMSVNVHYDEPLGGFIYAVVYYT